MGGSGREGGVPGGGRLERAVWAARAATLRVTTHHDDDLAADTVPCFDALGPFAEGIRYVHGAPPKSERDISMV